MKFSVNGIERKCEKFAFLVTALFIILLTFLCLVIKIEQKPKYEEISLRLDNPSTVKKNEPKKSESKIVEKSGKQSVVENSEKQVSSAKKSSSKKSASSEKKLNESENNKPVTKSSVSKSKTEFKEPEIKKSIEEQMAQMKTSSKKVEFDESLFSDEPENLDVREFSSQKNVAVAKSSMVGSSASSVEGENSSSQKKSASSSDSSADDSFSYSTKDALDGISFASSASNGVSGRTGVPASRTSAGAISMKMSDGSSRQLLYPKNPTISISEKNANLVDASKNVSVSFVVKSDGTVPFGGIQIVPYSAIPVEIQKEIKEQVSSWKFSEEESGKDASAVFNYSLEIK